MKKEKGSKVIRAWDEWVIEPVGRNWELGIGNWAACRLVRLPTDRRFGHRRIVNPAFDGSKIRLLTKQWLNGRIVESLNG